MNQNKTRFFLWTDEPCFPEKWNGNGFGTDRHRKRQSECGRQRGRERVFRVGCHIRIYYTHDKAQLVGYAKFINAILKMKSCYGFGPQCGAQQLQLSLLHFTAAQPEQRGKKFNVPEQTNERQNTHRRPVLFFFFYWHTIFAEHTIYTQQMVHTTIT